MPLQAPPVEIYPDFVEVDSPELLIEFGASFMQEARDMRQYADHYAGFLVGAVGVASNLEGEVEVFNGANRNLYPGTNPTKLCAEQSVVHQMRRKGFDRLHALYVCGPPQADTQSGLETPTLHICGECRDFMHDALEADESLVIVPVDPDTDAYEVYTFAELDALHAAGDMRTKSFNYYSDPGLRNAALAIAKAGGLSVQSQILTEPELRIAG